jgi:mRNA interferase RelE/StbE
VSDARFELVISPTARRQLTDRRPKSVAFAAYEFISGPLLDNPHRVGRSLGLPLADRHSARRGTYRIIYRIDEPHHSVAVVGVVHRADAYRPD